MLAIAEPRAKPKAECFYCPYGTDLPFASFPSTSYWATFTESLRDKSPHRTILALKLTRMRSRRIGYEWIQICALLTPVRLGPPCRRPILNATMCQLHMRRSTNSIPALKASAKYGSDPQSHQLCGLAGVSESRIEELFVMSHRRLGDEFRRPNKTKSSGIEYEVIEQRVFDIRIEIAS